MMKSMVCMLSVSATLGSSSGGFTSCGDPTQGPVTFSLVFSIRVFLINFIFILVHTPGT